MEKKEIKYVKCVNCSRFMPQKLGEYTNEGYKCNKHARMKRPLIMKPVVCKSCGRKVIPDMASNGLCHMCIDPKPLMMKKVGIGSNWSEHMMKKRHRLLKKKKRW